MTSFFLFFFEVKFVTFDSGGVPLQDVASLHVQTVEINSSEGMGPHQKINSTVSPASEVVRCLRTYRHLNESLPQGAKIQRSKYPVRASRVTQRMRRSAWISGVLYSPLPELIETRCIQHECVSERRQPLNDLPVFVPGTSFVDSFLYF